MKKIFTLFMTVITMSVFMAGCGNNAGQSDSGKIAGMQLTDIVNAIYEKKTPGFSLVTDTIDISNSDTLQYKTGLSNADKIKEALVSEPMIGSQAYALVLVRLKNSSDAQAVAQEMKDNIDPRRWICVEADDVRVVAQDDVVMHVMISSAFADELTAGDLADAFKEIAGSLSVDLK